MDGGGTWSHNPYFNRWFSAIKKVLANTDITNGHNPYFNRWFSAIAISQMAKSSPLNSHNPYFNRWFSAIKKKIKQDVKSDESQSLF